VTAVQRLKWAGAAAIALIFAAYARPDMRSLGYLPATVDVPVGTPARLSGPLPHGVMARAERGLMVDGGPAARPVAVDNGSLTVTGRRPGLYRLRLSLGDVPLRELRVRVWPRVRVVAGGESIGIALHTVGVLVVSDAAVTDGAGRRRTPARAAGIRPGDRILMADGRLLNGTAALAHASARAGRQGRPLVLGVVRHGRLWSLRVAPAWDGALRRYRIGAQVRDRVRGIGTLTFAEPVTGVYAALGHRIQDGPEGRPVPVRGGRIAAAAIVAVRRSMFGRPGEKVGTLLSGSPPWGDVRGNGPFGIYGRLAVRLPGPVLPIAGTSEVHPGPALLRTVLDGDRVESFHIRIERVYPQAADGRGMAIRVVDPRLVRRAGGIVQGMSGSPIIQDGRLVGAMTHVLVGDSTRGYAVFAEWMWLEARGVHANQEFASTYVSTA
jgi:stage IV sporulation protein B